MSTNFKNLPLRLLLFFTLIACFLQSSCTAVPLATVATLSKVDKDFYLGLQPELIRMEVVSELPIEVDINATYIKLIAYGRNRQDSLIRLNFRKLEEARLPKKSEYSGLFFSPTVKTNYALDEKSISSLSNLQREIRSGQVNGISLGVEHSLKASAPNKASLQVLLNQKQGYLKIINAASYP